MPRNRAAESARRRQRADELIRAGIPAAQARRAAWGHPREGEPGLRQMLRAPAWTGGFYTRDAEGNPTIVTARMGQRDAQKAGRAVSLARQLRQGEISPAEYMRRIRRIGTINGRLPLQNPAAVAALDAQVAARYRRGQDALGFESGDEAIRRSLALAEGAA